MKYMRIREENKLGIGLGIDFFVKQDDMDP